MLWFCIIYPKTLLFFPFCFLKENSVESFSVGRAFSDKTTGREIQAYQQHVLRSSGILVFTLLLHFYYTFHFIYALPCSRKDLKQLTEK